MNRTMPKLCLALDVQTRYEAQKLIEQTQQSVDVYKIGPAMLLRGGSSLLQQMHDFGVSIFLDLKLHDIPEAMMLATEAVTELGIDYLTVHASAGTPALKACVEMANRRRTPHLLAVTTLTSQYATNKEITNHMQRAIKAGVTAFVLSAQDIPDLHFFVYIYIMYVCNYV